MLNDRLKIASRLLETCLYTAKEALDLADELIALEKETRPKEAPQEGEPYNTAACHVKKGQLLQIKDNFIEIINIDSEYDNIEKCKIISLYLTNGFIRKFKYNEEVTVKDKTPN